MISNAANDSLPDTDTGTDSDTDIAIVGMAAHLPGAPSVTRYWENLRGGVCAIRQLDEAALLASGESQARMQMPNYVPAAATLDGFERFDAEFFGLSPRDAAIMDPQHRQFLEVAWHALEDAGHPPDGIDGPVGVFAGCGMGSYFYFNVCSNPDLVDDVGMFLLRHTGNDKDFLATRVSHVFDLKGPSINLQTACSTSLVATHYAVQALLTGECDLALAGGVTIELPHGRGYVVREGEILSPDGACHAFDHRAPGTVFGSGAGVVVLRRLKDAIADGDHIWAVIKGSAVNNDGAAKAGYLAPSVEGQAQAVAEAIAAAGVRADSIGYVECHGTGTYLGDPIEVAALTEAFAQTTDRKGFCRIGSVKTNIGHLDTAAGVASLIKAALALYHRQMPPSLGFEAPNPAIDFANSPFEVNATLTDWTGARPRRAGVNSLGVGGTNAHVILEEAPPRPPSPEADWPFQLITLSARSNAALDAQADALAAHLRAHPDQPLADVAWTLQAGRRAFEKRRIVVAGTHEEAAARLESRDARRVHTHSAPQAANAGGAGTVFMFPGGGAQYPGMARDLFETEPVFREWMERGLAFMKPRGDVDLAALWLADGMAPEDAATRLHRPSLQLPLIMITEYALAQLYMSWGVEPAALIGHSMGENTAACLAGVMSFEDCIGLVHLRGQLFDDVPAGGMLSVPLSRDEVGARIGDGLDIAAVNAPGLTVVSGPQDALDRLAAQLHAEDIEAQRIPINIAAHSRLLDPILEPFGAYLRTIALSAPRIPVISNRSGTWLTDTEATDPDYWVRHLRHTVHFADGLSTLKADPARIYLEVGPGKALSGLARAHGGLPAGRVFSALRHPDEPVADDAHFLETLGRLWACGTDFDWDQLWGEAQRQRVPLPGYAFQRAPYFIEPGAGQTQPGSDDTLPERRDDPAEWGYRPAWRPRLADCPVDVAHELETAERHSWLIFDEDSGPGAQVATRLRSAGHRVVEVRPGDAFTRLCDDVYTLAPEHGRDGYDRLMHDLMAQGMAPDRIGHFWLLTGDESFRPGSSFFHRNMEHGFHSLLFLAQAIESEGLPRPLHVTVVTSGAARLAGDDRLPYPGKATVMGPAMVIPRELAGVTCAVLDMEQAAQPARRRARRGAQATSAADDTIDRLLEELLATPANTVAAWRGHRRYEREFRRVSLPAPDAAPLPRGGVWLITGGFGGIGVTVAEELIRQTGATIVLLARTPLPAPQDWDAWLRDHPPHDATARRIRAVQRLQGLGGTVLTEAADVCNLEQMRMAVSRITEAVGAPTGVIHAAGVIDDAPLMTKSTGAIEAVLAPKLHGTQVLDTVFPDGTLEVMVLFSSSSTVTAPAGQVDYVAANEYLNAFAQSRAGGRTRVLAIDWGPWAQIGMAAEAVAAQRGAPAPVAPEPVTAPLLDSAGFDAGGNRLFTARYSTERWVFDEHRTASGAALMPGTGYLEQIAEALRAHGESGGFEIRDLYFFRPVEATQTPRETRLRLSRSEAGYDVEIRSAMPGGGRTGYALNAQASVALGAPTADSAPIDPAAIRARCNVASAEDPHGLRIAQQAHLAFGPRWRALRQKALGHDEGIARLSLPPEFAQDMSDGYLLHPALMDMATGWAMELSQDYDDSHMWVPVAYRSVRVLRPLPADLFSWVRLDRGAQQPGFVSFDITLCDIDGQRCVEIGGFSMKRLDAPGDLVTSGPPRPGELVFDEDDAATGAQSPAQQRLAQTIARGIRPEEGGAAFMRALGADLPQVVVTSLDLDALIRQSAAPAGGESADPDARFQRPQLDQAYVAPRTDIERTLAGFWSDLLGIDEIGVEDSFFDLGGHSLIAVRLFAMVRKTYDVEFPISVLFEAPTIAACAAMIAERIGAAGSEAASEERGMAPRKSAAPRFAHLVAMHDGEGGPRTPFFLVAGMFGNVLNLRHLAALLGTERPFYGLQARGLMGDAQPHRSIEAAATDYIAEMRAVQPEGPYLLGGFSGGGITAWEIARQLEASGDKVALLVMLDTPLPVRPSLTRIDRAMIKAQELRRKGPGYLLEWGRNRIRWELARRAAPADAPQTGAQQFHDAAIEAAFREAVAAYSLAPWSGPVALFRPPLDRRWKVSRGNWVSAAREYVFDDNAWARWAPDLRIFEVPGDHDSMVLEPNVRVLAARMKSCIEDAEAGQDPAARAAAE